MKKDKKRAPTTDIAPSQDDGPADPAAAPAFDPAAPDQIFGGAEESTEVSAPTSAQLSGEGVDGLEVTQEVEVTVDGEGMLVEPVNANAGADDAPPVEGEEPPVDSAGRLESILESLLFASDRPLAIGDLKRLVNERDAKKLTAALERLQARHEETGIQLVAAGGGWQFRTHPGNAPWVAKLIAGRPARLSRAMLETLAIVAYRQPITRPEIDEIRGVDCGPVLKTLLDRALIRMIGKKEEVGRPILYGTTPEFLRTFSLKDLNQLPTLREFHELGVAEMAKVDAQSPATAAATAAASVAAVAAASITRVMPSATELPEHDADEEDALLAELDEATTAATRASKPGEAKAPPPEISE